MSVPLYDSPASILSNLLFVLGQTWGTSYGITLSHPPIASQNDNTAWPVYYSNEPDRPDNCVTVYDTDNQDDGRSHVDGEGYFHYGFQVRVRATNSAGFNAHDVGYRQGQIIQKLLEEQTKDVPIHPDVNGVFSPLARYKVLACTRLSLRSLGADVTNTKRRIFVLNGFAAILPLF